MAFALFLSVPVGAQTYFKGPGIFTATGSNPVTNLVWDATRADSDITLSNGLLLATHTGVTAQDTIVPATVFLASGCAMFTVTFGNVTNTHTAIGIASSATLTSATHYLGQTANSLGVSNTGNVLLNNSSLGNTNVSFTTGDTVDLAIDLTNKLLWERKNGGPWNGAAGNSPGGQGGIDGFNLITGGSWAPAVDVYSQNDSANLLVNLVLPGCVGW